MLDAWITQAAADLGRAFDAERVLVFGSRATGEATRRSDLDLFVVARSDEPALARMGKAMALLADLPCAVDPIIYTPEELERRSESKFIRHVFRTGVVAWERPR